MPRKTPQDEKLARIWRAVGEIPRGKVASYGAIARRAGLTGRARLVGYALKQAPDEINLPWHRVINGQGRISFPEGSEAHQRQRQLLEAEGVVFIGGKVVKEHWSWAVSLDEYLWKPNEN